MAIKRRGKKTAARKAPAPPTDEQVEAFAAGADSATPRKRPSPNAKRDYKSIRVPFNEYEYQKLDKACRLSGRSKLSFLRAAMLEMASKTR